MNVLNIAQKMVLLSLTGLVMVFSSVIAESGSTVAAAQDEMENDTLVIVARLVEIPGKFAPNDAYDYVYVMKYRVVKVEQGTLADREILVGQYNPLIPRKLINDKMKGVVKGNVEKFVVGERHRLKLVTPIEDYWSGAVETEYYDTDLKTFFAVSTETVK